MSRRFTRRLLVGLGLSLGLAFILDLAFMNGLFTRFQQQSTDFLFKARGELPASRTVIVAVDDRSLAELSEYGRFFTWPRSLHAQVIQQLTQARARTIAFDVLFDVPAPGDAELIQAMTAHGNVIQPVAGDPSSALPPGPGPQAYRSVISPLAEIAAASPLLGHANQAPDGDGTVRRAPMFLRVNDTDVPSLPLAAVARFLRRPQVADGPIHDGAFPFAGRQVPVDDDTNMIVNFRGGPSDPNRESAFTVVPFVDVLRGDFPPGTFDGKLVFVGVTALAFADDYWTPPSIRERMDGVEIHANAAETLLQADFLRPAPQAVTSASIFLAAVIAGLALVILPPLAAFGVSALALAVYVGLAFTFFDASKLDYQLGPIPIPSLLLNLFYPPLALALSSGGVMLYRTVFEQRQQRALRGALSQYLSPDVMREVAANPESVRLGGEKRVMTVMFSDLRGFTSYSETIDPQELVHILNQYLTEMTDEIFRHQGTVDKYMGDAIMAFWGAPRPQADHARRACNTAVDMMSELEILNNRWQAEGKQKLSIGIGINTGPMTVGNMGSQKRLDYTVMGDSVNLASRLEGLNKEYGTNIIVSDSTLTEVGDGYVTRYLDLVIVKGRSTPVAVYELIGRQGQVSDEKLQVLSVYEEGGRLYSSRDWLGAAARFQEVLRLDPNDSPAALYLERCEALMADPPPEEWDGVYVMTHK
ncbi:MAG TPA: adenylate/guanylate cyclase domain-containing protein [Chloroflexota bacterium]|nr:adenylate/guanylate cyclase domain-containing protein [Chloroflexota bacterium]